MKKKIAIVGASFLQRPLVLEAKRLGLETHVFAWKKHNSVEDVADYFYPISVLEKEAILSVCKKILISGIVSIASDIAMPTVNFIANELGLIGNSLTCTSYTTNKFEMRKKLAQKGIPCPKFKLVKDTNNPIQSFNGLQFPVIVKPIDRSGSRGVTKVNTHQGLSKAIEKAISISITGQAIVEEFIVGTEYSVEMISYRGQHFPIQITAKTNTGAPSYVELSLHQPAELSKPIKDLINKTVTLALETLEVEYGASHSEVFVLPNGDVRIIEVAARMAGDFIGSHLVKLSTGYDYLKAVILIALNKFDEIDYNQFHKAYSGAFYITANSGTITSIENNAKSFDYIMEALPILKVGEKVMPNDEGADKRLGIIVYQHPSKRMSFAPKEVLKFRMV